jgi:hypothetical protein
MRNVADKPCTEDAHILRSRFFFRTSCYAQGNVEKIGTAGQAIDYIIRRMHLACWMTKDTDTHSEYVTLIAFPRNSGYAKESQCYVIRTLTVLLFIASELHAFLFQL